MLPRRKSIFRMRYSSPKLNAATPSDKVCITMSQPTHQSFEAYEGETTFLRIQALTEEVETSQVLRASLQESLDDVTKSCNALQDELHRVNEKISTLQDENEKLRSIVQGFQNVQATTSVPYYWNDIINPHIETNVAIDVLFSSDPKVLCNVTQANAAFISIASLCTGLGQIVFGLMLWPWSSVKFDAACLMLILTYFILGNPFQVTIPFVSKLQ